MLDVHIDLLGLGIKFDVSHEPRLLRSEDLLVKFGFLHRRSPSRRILTDPQTSRMDQLFPVANQPAPLVIV
jgi:hypothetical protein